MQTITDKSIEFLKKELSKFTNRAYFVGGCVRDLILRKPICDIDIEVFDISQNDFEALMQKIGAIGVGKSFFVYKYNGIDISLPRVEKKISQGHRGFQVSLSSDTKEASKRRDFSMNALMLNIFDNTLLDHWNGLRDIKLKSIKIIDEQKFQEDSLRVLRAMQFSARLGFKIDPNSIKIMQKMKLDDLSSERIFWEFEKMFYSKYLHFGLYYLFQLGIAQKVLNLKIDFSTFLKTALEMQRGRVRFEDELYGYYFLYILSKNLNLDFEYIVSKLKAPTNYKKMLKKQVLVPKKIDKYFLMMLSLNYPIKEWLGNYIKGVKEKSIDIGIYDKMYDGGVSAKDVIKDGFKSKEITIELQRRKKEKIKQECR